MDRYDAKRDQIVAVVLHGKDPGTLVAGDVMTLRPTCVPPTTTALQLVELFHQREFRHPLVADEQGRLLGVISDRDVLRCFGTAGSPSCESLTRVTAGEIMSTDLVTVSACCPLVTAVRTMFEHGIHCLPVVEGERLVGILTSTDLYLVLESMLEPATSASSV